MADQPDAPASDWPDVSPAGLRKMAKIAAPNNGAVFRAAADEIERLSAQPVAQAPESGDLRKENDTITELNHAQWLALGKARLLVAAGNRIDAESEEFDFDDGMGRGILQAYWDEFTDALEQTMEALADCDTRTHHIHTTTPTEASNPVQAEAPKPRLTINLKRDPVSGVMLEADESEQVEAPSAQMILQQIHDLLLNRVQPKVFSESLYEEVASAIEGVRTLLHHKPDEASSDVIAMLQRVRESIVNNRCDGSSDYAAGVAAANSNMLQHIDHLIAGSDTDQPSNVVRLPVIRQHLHRLVEDIKETVYRHSGEIGVAEAIGALEVAKLEIFQEHQ